LKRPLSITIIAWLSILAGVVCFLFLLFVALYADSASSQNPLGRFRGAGLFIVGTMAALAGGVLVLRGLSLGRLLILAALVALLAESLEQQALVIVTYGLLLVVCGYFLFRPQASDYFRGSGKERGSAN
jgi:hypothetical protein